MSKQLSHERLVAEVKQDYLNRREKRRSLEAQWQLNINFYLGNQYSYIKPNNNLSDYEKQYFWQEKEIFNHITPTMETRLAKVLQFAPEVKVLPASAEDHDINSAKLSKEIFNAVANRVDLKNIIKNATTWSEICGTSFYKVIWNSDKGLVFASNEKNKAIKLGDVDISICSPFEIFPDNLSCESMADIRSIIHAKAVDVSVIKNLYGVNIQPEKCYSFSLNNQFNSVGGLGYDSSIKKVVNSEVENSCVLIERYTRPDDKNPNGRLTIIAGDKLLFDGELPYCVGEDGARDLPFIKQTSCYVPGNFFGASVVERLIPVQRAYNAVRNRKHEYFNRVSMGVLAVESGSVDTDALEQDGLSPGKVLVYRQGCKTPEIMDTPNINDNFTDEEERLLDEFKTISGVNDLMKQDYSAFNNMSGTAIQLLMEQDEQRIKPSIDEVKYSMVKIAKFILRLYKQFAYVPRLIKLAGTNGKVKLYYWDQNEISSEDITLEAEPSLGETVATRRTSLMELINSGILYDDNGKFSESTRRRCLDLLGLGIWENNVDLHSLHINRAQEENIKMLEEKVEPIEIDNHDIHIDEHTAFVLANSYKNNANAKEIEEKLIEHINKHKEMKNK